VDTADRATRAELTDGKSPADAQDVETVLEAFAAERLLTLAAGTVELSHEVLLTAWPLAAIRSRFTALHPGQPCNCGRSAGTHREASPAYARHR
jgi:hypothetical protein